MRDESTPHLVDTAGRIADAVIAERDLCDALSERVQLRADLDALLEAVGHLVDVGAISSRAPLHQIYVAMQRRYRKDPR